MKLTVIRLAAAALIVPSGAAQAQEGSPDCTAVFADLYADISDTVPVDLDQCEPETPVYVLDECTPPESFTPGAVTTHLILAIDASGSMAGPAGGMSKMEAAKREAQRFLTEMHDDIEVGLMVYGHEGTNQPEGKDVSCAATELIHGFDTRRSEVDGTIAALQPTGWTPLAGVLDHAGEVVAALPLEEGEPGPVPVVYLISDGEETCDGDPVASAKALIEAGVSTHVNTIGFGVDAVTAAQLEAIAEAGGGTYYPAKDARALQEQLDAIRETEAAAARYRYCVDLNAGKIAMATHNEIIKMTGCFQRNNPQQRMSALMRAVNEARDTGGPVAECTLEISRMALAENRRTARWLVDRTGPMNEKVLEETEALYRDAGLRDD